MNHRTSRWCIVRRRARPARNDRAEDRISVHPGGDARKDFANLDAGHAGGDRFELATNFAGSICLDVPHVLVRRPAAQKHIDHSPVRSARASLGLGAQNIRQGQRTSANP